MFSNFCSEPADRSSDQKSWETDLRFYILENPRKSENISLWLYSGLHFKTRWKHSQTIMNKKLTENGPIMGIDAQAVSYILKMLSII